MVRTHLALCFKHEIDPSFGDAQHQAELNEVHANMKLAPTPIPGGGSCLSPTFVPGSTLIRC
jgi:hypothetical protein